MFSILQNFANNTGKFTKILGRDAVGLTKTNLLHTEEYRVASQYQHIGNILYYATNEAEPQVYIDPGIRGVLNDKERKISDLPQFREIEYVDTDNNVAETLGYNHMFIVCGPGLSLSWQPFLESELDFS